MLKQVHWGKKDKQSDDHKGLVEPNLKEKGKLKLLVKLFVINIHQFPDRLPGSTLTYCITVMNVLLELDMAPLSLASDFFPVATRGVATENPSAAQKVVSTARVSCPIAVNWNYTLRGQLCYRAMKIVSVLSVKVLRCPHLLWIHAHITVNSLYSVFLQ